MNRKINPISQTKDKEAKIMIDFIKVIAIVMGVAFPAFLIKAIKAQNEDKISKYTILACISFGIVIFALMGLL